MTVSSESLSAGFHSQAGAFLVLSLYFLTFPQHNRIMAVWGVAKHPDR